MTSRGRKPESRVQAPPVLTIAFFEAAPGTAQEPLDSVRDTLESSNIESTRGAIDVRRNDFGSAMNFDKELDARGLNCPLPILKAKKALTDMTTGQVLRIIATDPGSVKDFEAFAKQTGNPLLSQAATANEFTFFLRKK